MAQKGLAAQYRSQGTALQIYAMAYGAISGIGLGAGIGLGILGNGAMNALGRNPEARDAIVPNMILALAFTEAIGIYGLVTAILLIFVA